MQAELKLLGGYELLLADGAPLRLTSRKSFALLAILAQRADRAVPREEIATLLWGDRGEDQARASLRQELSVLRRTLSRRGLDCVEASKEAVLLDSRQLRIDIRAAEALIADGSAAAAEELATLYRGDFLAGLDIRSEAFEDWRRLYREQLRDRVLETLHEALVENRAQPEIARALLRVDETQEEAHRALMRYYWQTGRRGEALQQYQRCLDALHRELDAEPEPDTQELFEEIRDTTAPTSGRSPGPLRPDGSTAPERRQLTVAVFGFALPEDLDRDPESLSALLIDFAAHCREQISAYGGKIIDQADGRMIALFGHPRAHESDDARAVMAALGLLEKPFRDAQGRALALRAGLAMGETLVGQQGSDGAIVSVAGPAVMTASRIELQAEPGEIRVAGAMRQTLRGQFRMRPAEPRSTAPQVQVVLGERAHADRFFASDVTRQLTRLTGREAELADMLQRWEAATRGTLQVVALRGEAGIGKSRLLSDFRKRALADEPRLLQFSGSPHHQKSVLYPLVQHLQQVLGFAQLPDPGARRMRLRTWLEQRPGLDIAQVEQVLAALLGLSPDPEDKLRDQDALLSAIVALLRQAARQGRPVLLLVEDMHWLDPTSQLLLRHLANDLEDLPLMMLGTSRQAEGVAVPKPLRMHSIVLDRLDPGTATALVRGICPSNWSESRIAEIVERSDGIPLYLEELVHTAVSGGDGAAIPSSLQASLTARIDRLDGARILLQQAAVIGRVFDIETLANLAGRPAPELEPTLRELQQLDLVYRLGRAEDARYEFKHALVQEQAHQTILLAERAALHSRLGDILVASDAPEPAELIARHYEQGGRFRDAIARLEIAGKQALRVAAHTEADAHFARAAELARALPEGDEASALELKYLLLRGPQLLALHGFAAPEIEANYARALKLADNVQDRSELAHVYWGLWSFYVVRANLTTATHIAGNYLKLCRELGDEVGVIAANYALGVTRYYAGALPEAQAAFREAVDRHRPGLHEAQIERYGLDLSVCAGSYLCWLYALCGAPRAARRASTAAIAAAEAHAHDFSMAFAHVFTGVMYHFLRAPQPALEHGLIAERLADQHGYAQWRAQAEMVIGYARHQRGDPGGRALLDQGTEAYLATGACLALPYARAWQAEIALETGDTEGARSLLQSAREAGAQSGELYFEAELLRLEARCGDDALALLRRALETASTSGAHLLALRAAHDLAKRTSDPSPLRSVLAGLPEQPEESDTADIPRAQGQGRLASQGEASR